MAGMREFFTRFNIGAVFTGQAGINQATKAIQGTEKAAKSVNVSFASMARGIIGSQVVMRAGSAVFRGVTSGIASSVDAAREASAVYEGLGKSIERNATRWNMNAEAAAKYSATIKGTAAEQEKVGHDAEVLATGYTRLQDAIKPEQFAQMAPIFSDVLTKVSGVNAGMADSAALADVFVQSIVGGKPTIMKMIDATEQQKQAFSKASTEAERYAIFLQAAAKWSGETARQFDTAPGQLAQMNTQMGNLAETMGGPFVAAAVALVPAVRSIALALAPVAEKFSAALTPAMERFGTVVQANVPAIVAMFEKLGAVIVWMIDHWQVTAVAMTAVGIAIAALLGPIGIIAASLAGLGAAALLLMAYWDQLVAALQSTELGAAAITGLSALWANTVKEFEAISAAVQGFVAVLATVASAIQQAFGGDFTALYAVWAGLVNYVQVSVVGAIVSSFQGMAAAVSAALSGVASAIIAAFVTPISAIKAAWSGLVGFISGIASQVKSAASSIMSGAAAASAGHSVPQTTGMQMGGLVSNPTVTALAEKGIPEMVIPLQGTERSRGLLSQAASMIGGASKGMVGGAMSVSMNAPITINGVPAGQEQAIGREVQRAMQDPIKNLLDQIKAARAYESRLGYI